MERFFYKHALYIAIFLFVIAVFISADQVVAFGKPDGVGDHTFPPQTNERPNLPYGTVSPDPSRPFPPFGKIGGSGSTSGTFQPGASRSHFPGFAQVHLQGGKLQACQSMEKNLTNRSGHLVDLVTQMEKIFTSIAMGVENYYLTKVVPTGTTLLT